MFISLHIVPGFLVVAAHQMWWEYLCQNMVVKNIQLGGNIPQTKCKIYIKISVLANAIVHKKLSFRLLDKKYSASGKQNKLIKDTV